MVPCDYDPELRCFKTDLMIRVGQRFRFSVDDGKRYLTSARYASTTDDQGNVCNIYDP